MIDAQGRRDPGDRRQSPTPSGMNRGLQFTINEGTGPPTSAGYPAVCRGGGGVNVKCTRHHCRVVGGGSIRYFCATVEEGKGLSRVVLWLFLLLCGQFRRNRIRKLW